MQVSKQKLNGYVEKNIYNQFNQLVEGIVTLDESECVFSDLLSATERTAICKRLAIATALRDKQSYEEIKDKYKVSSATIASVQEKSRSEGLKMAMKILSSANHNESWSDKVGAMFKR